MHMKSEEGGLQPRYSHHCLQHLAVALAPISYTLLKFGHDLLEELSTDDKIGSLQPQPVLFLSAIEVMRMSILTSKREHIR